MSHKTKPDLSFSLIQFKKDPKWIHFKNLPCNTEVCISDFFFRPIIFD